MNGILVVDKPEGFTSFDVVAKLRGICRTKKIGHGGTLDPMATGVLPVFIGPAVKAVDLQPCQDKQYEAELQFGIATDTGDITGEMIKTGPGEIDPGRLQAALEAFVGTRQQLPPMYSAVKVDGKPLYRYAREGIAVSRKVRTVTFHSIELLGQAHRGRWRIRVHCSKGTYIRTLVEDLGETLGSCATLTALQRTAAGIFTLAGACTLAEVQAAKDIGRLEDLLCPVEKVFEDWPQVQVGEEAEMRLLNGATVYGVKGIAGLCRLAGTAGFLGLGRLLDDGSLQAEKMLVERDGLCR